MSAALPNFVEIFMDNGCCDMQEDDEGAVRCKLLRHREPGPFPGLAGRQYSQTAYGFACIRALLNRASA